MGRMSIAALRIVLVGAMGLALFLQGFIVPVAAWDEGGPSGEFGYLRPAFLGYLVLVGLVVELCIVCVWKLATRVRRGTVFNPAAFKYVDVIIATIGVGALGTFALAAVMAPGEAVASGLVLLTGGLGVLVAGIALIVLVLRQLLAQATSTDLEAQRLRTELGGVI